MGVIDTARHKLASTIEFAPIEGAATPPRPMGGVLSPDGQQVFISLGRAGAIAVIDVATRKVVRTIEGVGARPWGIALSADGYEALHRQRAQRRRLDRRRRERQGREEGRDGGESLGGCRQVIDWRLPVTRTVSAGRRKTRAAARARSPRTGRRN